MLGSLFCGLLVVAAGNLGAEAPPSTSATQAEAKQRHASIEIDTSDVGEAGPIIQRRVRERGDVVLRDAGILPARGPDDLTIQVVVRELRGEEPGFLYTLSTQHKGKTIGDREQLECQLCTESEIVARIEDALALIASDLPDVPEQDETEDAVTTTPPPDDSTDTPTGRAPLGGMGKAGIGLLATGTAAVGAGVVLVVLPPKVDRDDPLFETTTRPPGWGVLAGGAATAIVGAVLLGLDRKKQRNKARTAMVGPWFDKNGAGVNAIVRF